MRAKTDLSRIQATEHAEFVPLTACWPLNREGPLPSTLIDPEFLEKVFFRIGPTVWNCPAQSIRRALKLLLKKVARDLQRKLPPDQAERDRVMAMVVCNEPRTRERLHELEISVEERVSRLGRVGVRVGVLGVNKSLPELLWLGYCEDPAFEPLVRWIEHIGIERADLGRGNFITGPVLEDAVLSGTAPPLPMHSLDVARALYAFGALLPEVEALQLFTTASRLGCIPFQHLLLAVDKHASPHDTTEAAETADDLTASQALAPASTLPRLKHPDLGNVSPIPELMVSSAVSQVISTFIDQDQERQKIEQHTAEAFQEGIHAVLKLSDSDFQAAINLLAAGHQASLAAADASHTCVRMADELTSLAYAAIGIPEHLKPKVSDNSDVSSILANLREADALHQLSAHFDASIPELVAWRDEIRGALTKTDLEHLFALRCEFNMAREARRQFTDAAQAFLAQSHSTSEIENWLRVLDRDELVCLLRILEDKPWLVPAAVLLRFGIDRSPAAFTADFAAKICSAHNCSNRRVLLRFCDPASSALDSEPSARRVVVLERLRDILHLGPMALITDPSSGLSDVDLVGRTAADITELIASNLQLFSSVADLKSIIAPRHRLNEAMVELVKFASTPSTLKGHYRRLRERARETLFLPLIRGEQVDKKRASELAQHLRSQDVSERIFTEVSAETGHGDRLEARHKIHLDRYLQHGRQLLDELVSKSSFGPSGHDTAVRRVLTSLVRQLRRGDDIGSLPWFEGEVAKMLSGQSPAPEIPTLVGDTTPIEIRRWGSEDTVWAQNYISLPNFYIDEELGTLTVAAAALAWRGKGRAPTIRDIVDELVSKRRHRAAFSALDDAEASADLKEELRGLIDNDLRPVLEGARRRIAALREQFGEFAISQSSILPGVEAALGNLDIDEAYEQCELLEVELLEGASQLTREPNKAATQERRDILVRLLLLAGTAGVDERASIDDLEARWNAELHRRESERIHLLTAESAFRTVETSLPVLAENFVSFVQENLSADRWVAPTTSATFSECIADAALKLQTWVASSPVFAREARHALVSLSMWFMHFVGEQSETLHSIGSDEAVNSVFDRIIEALDCVVRSADPVTCLQLLQEIGEGPPQTSTEPSESVQTQPAPKIEEQDQALVESAKDAVGCSSYDPKLASALESQEWKLVSEVCRELRVAANDDEVRRLDDVAEFARTMDAISRGALADASETLGTAARLLGTTGQVVHRSYPIRTLIDFGYKTLAAALFLEQGAVDGATIRPEPGGSWAPLLGRRVDFFRGLDTGTLSGRTMRVVEHLCAGALGGEVAERIWDAATKMPEPGAMRAAFLSFLHERSLFEHIVRLASRYEPGIKSKLEQLLELRGFASERPDLVPVTQLVAEQVGAAAKSGPFKMFVRSLPSAAQAVDPCLRVDIERGLVLRFDEGRLAALEVPIAIEPRGLVPEKLEVSLFPEDDVAFEDGSRRKLLSDQPLYIPRDYTLTVRLGDSWTNEAAGTRDDSLRLRVSARTLMGDLVNQDAACPLKRQDPTGLGVHSIDSETLLDLYPGVGNTPVRGEAFIGRTDELERLHEHLISARTPSPVLLTGMRRIGKTSLLYALHGRCRQPGQSDAVTVYLSIAERQAAFTDPKQDVGSVVFNAIAYTLSKRKFPAADHNREVGERLQSRLGEDRGAVRRAIEECRDPESLADSIMLLGERLIEWLDSTVRRVIFLIDEAEALVLAYHGDSTKRLQLEQFLRSLREVTQTSEHVGILLSGSNHINEFAREYKNAFFGSCVTIDLSGIEDIKFARQIVAPSHLKPFVQFDEAAIQYAVRLCAGMPQFMWQVGAATTFLVRSGPATRADVRCAVTSLVNDVSGQLPFKPYDVLEPLEHMLGLQGAKERDLLWLLLYRIANASSLVAEQAPLHFVLDQMLMELDDRDRWKRRLISLIELKILEMPKPSTYQFKVPIFAEGFRAPRNRQECLVRQQRAGS